MSTATPVLLLLALAMMALAYTHKREGIPDAMRSARRQIILLGLRLPLALASAAFIAILVPPTVIAPFIGADTGWEGIALAGLFGAIVPGGPILTFPLALVIWRAGAGEAQMVTFLASWSVFAVHRLISYELPMLGPRFIAIRLASSWMLPFLAGALALGLIAFWGTDAPPPSR